MKYFIKVYFYIIKNLSVLHKKSISNPHIKKYYDKFNLSHSLEKNFTRWNSHEYMLSDKKRVNTYKLAINKYINSDSIVLDLGAGTGILSFFAAKAGAKKIYAVERSEIIETAKLIAKEHEFSNISFIHSDSSKVNTPHKIDIIIQEQMGSLLFQENMIEIVLDIRDRLLEKGGKILPNKFRFYVEPIELKDNLKLPFLWEFKFDDIDYSSVKNLSNNADYRYYFRSIRANDVKLILSEPSPLIEFDLETLQKDQIKLNYVINRKVLREGNFDAFCLFFDANFDDNLYLSTNPLNEDFPKNWATTIFRVESKFCSKNSVISYNLNIGSIEDIKTWSFTYPKE